MQYHVFLTHFRSAPAVVNINTVNSRLLLFIHQ